MYHKYVVKKVKILIKDEIKDILRMVQENVKNS